MIEFKITEDQPLLEENPIVSLWLQKHPDGITVVGMDNNGNSSNLVRLLSDGKVHRCLGVKKKLPFILNEDSQIIER